MRQYWINFKGRQDGPMSLEQMAQMGVDESAYVWHSGLPDWVKITAVPELNEMLQKAKFAPHEEEEVPQLPQEETTNDDLVEQNTANPVEDVVGLDEAAEDALELNNIDEEVPELDEEHILADPDGDQQSPASAYSPHMGSGMPIAQQAASEVPKCPPTNLVWAIIATVLCCTPAGIVAIVFAYLTKKNYREGNYEKAQRMSDWGAWMVIASIILGIIMTPLSCAMQMAKIGMVQ